MDKKDSLIEMFEDLRKALPTGERSIGYMPWLEGIAEIICCLPDGERQMACTILVANDLCQATDVPLPLCFNAVLWAVDKQKAVRL